MTTATMGVEERNTKGFKSDLGDLTVNNQKQLQLLLSAASLPLVQGPSGEMTEWLSAVVKRGDRGSRLGVYSALPVFP